MNCHAHPDRPGIGRTDPLGGPLFHCAECWAAMAQTKAAPTYATQRYREQRAYGTGLGPQAHAEAQEARRYADDWERLKATYRETWRK